MLDKNISIVGVACGGYGSEKEISLKSGKTVYDSLINSGWKVFLIIINTDEWYIKTSASEKIKFNKDEFSFKYNKKNYQLSVIFNAVHGPPGENGELAILLKNKNIPHTSCDFISANKTYSKIDCLKEVKKFNIPTAKSIQLEKKNKWNEDQIIKKTGLPCFVKANRAGSSFGVYKVSSKSMLRISIESAFKYDNKVLIESELKGREVSVGVYRDNDGIKCLPVTEIISDNEFFDYEAKYLGKAKEITPALIPDEWSDSVKKISVYIYEKLNLRGVCRSEYIFINNTPHLLEINSVPGLTGQSIIPKQCEAAGIRLQDFFELLLQKAFDEK
ncbi:MAG: D-alanine--D-alanine ligase A [Flavobacteriaceae bacterium]|nr:D-alanine--D-alanine ligase A [Flavobacteriaceae bacterium]|tara:strand:- start:12030 stop:13022 length:993 start_codon:yes stop_codon:yes gene_type:complete